MAGSPDTRRRRALAFMRSLAHHVPQERALVERALAQVGEDASVARAAELLRPGALWAQTSRGEAALARLRTAYHETLDFSRPAARAFAELDGALAEVDELLARPRPATADPGGAADLMTGERRGATSGSRGTTSRRSATWSPASTARRPSPRWRASRWGRARGPPRRARRRTGSPGTWPGSRSWAAGRSRATSRVAWCCPCRRGSPSTGPPRRSMRSTRPTTCDAFPRFSRSRALADGRGHRGEGQRGGGGAARLDLAAKRRRRDDPRTGGPGGEAVRPGQPRGVLVDALGGTAFCLSPEQLARALDRRARTHEARRWS